MKTVSLVAFTLAGALLGPIAARADAESDASALTKRLSQRHTNGVIAVVEGKAIGVAEVVRRMEPQLPGLRQAASGETDYEQRVDRLAERVVQDLIARAQQVRELRADPTRQVPAEQLDRALQAEMAERFAGDRTTFLAHVRAEGKTLKGYRREREDDILVSAVPPRPQADATAVEPAVRLRMIRLNRRADETDVALKSRADALLVRFKAGEKFDDLARELSDDPRRERGGDWDWRTRGDFRSEFADVAFGLAKGEASASILLPEGALILLVDDRR